MKKIINFFLRIFRFSKEKKEGDGDFIVHLSAKKDEAEIWKMINSGVDIETVIKECLIVRTRFSKEKKKRGCIKAKEPEIVLPMNRLQSFLKFPN